MKEEKLYTLTEAHRHFAIQTNSLVWDLLSKTERTKNDEEDLVHAAHTSCYHWLQAGTPVHHQRGLWLLAHVYTTLRQTDRALHYARFCMDVTQENEEEMADFDHAYALFGLARAYALAGERTEAKHYYVLAKSLGESIQNEEDRKLFLMDLDQSDWFGIV